MRRFDIGTEVFVTGSYSEDAKQVGEIIGERFIFPFKQYCVKYLKVTHSSYSEAKEYNATEWKSPYSLVKRNDGDNHDTKH